MPNEVQTARVVIEPEVHIWPGQTQTIAALDAADAEPPLTVTQQEAVSQIEELQKDPSYTDPFHPQHAETVAKLTVLYRSKCSDDDKPPAETLKEQVAGFTTADTKMLSEGAEAVFGEGALDRLQGTAMDNDVAARQLIEVAQAERDGYPVGEYFQKYFALTPNEARQKLRDLRNDEKFMRTYHNSGDFFNLQPAAVAEMRALTSIANGEIRQWQALLQQPQS